MCTGNSIYLQVFPRTHAASQVTPCAVHNMWHLAYCRSTRYRQGDLAEHAAEALRGMCM